MNELKVLYKIYNSKQLKYPREVIVKRPRKGIIETRFNVDNRREVWSRIRELERAKNKQYKCFFCYKYFKEDKGGRWMPMDKREYGDGDFGHAFACYKCCPREYGRL